METGRKPISDAAARKLARALGVTPDRVKAASGRAVAVKSLIDAAGAVLPEALPDATPAALKQIASVLRGLGKLADDDGLDGEIRDAARQTARELLSGLGVDVGPATKRRADRDEWGRKQTRRSSR